MPNPQAAAPDSGAAAAPQGGAPQGNPLKDGLGKIVQLLHTLASQNTVVQDDLNKAVMSLVQAIQKVDQASPSAPQQPPAPPQQ
jgi:hypothetical protein